MVSFRDAVPPDNPADMATLAQRMNLSRPVSLRHLLGFLGPPTAVQFNSGTLRTSGIAASGLWSLNAQGFWNFTGSLNNSDAIPQQFGFGMALNVRDANGNRLGVAHSDQVGPNLPLFNNNASWNETGFDQRIIDLWPAIFGARSAGAATRLDVSIDAGDVLVDLGLVAGAVFIAAAGLFIGGRRWQCDPVTVQATEGGTGVEGVWRCSPE